MQVFSDILDIIRSVYKTILIKLYQTDTHLGKHLATLMYYLVPLRIEASDIANSNVTHMRDHFSTILNVSENGEHLDELLKVSIDNGFDINDFKTEFTYTNDEGKKISYKQSPIRNIIDSTDTTDKIKILIKHGIDLTYQDPNDPDYIDFLSALLRNSQLSAESIDDLLGFMHDHGLDINKFKTEFTYINHDYTNDEGKKISYKQSPIRNIIDSTDTTDKIKILIKHGIDLTYQDPNDPDYIDFLSALLRNSQLSAESIDDLLGFMHDHGLDINKFKTEFTYINHEGKVSYKESPITQLAGPIMNLNNSTDNTEKIKILIKHGIDLTYNDPNDPYYTDFLSALLRNSQLSAESIDDLLGFMRNHDLDINNFKSRGTYINRDGKRVSYKQSPIRTITDSADATDKIKILIKHGIDLTYQDPNDPDYIDFLSALLRNSQLSAESIDDLLGFMHDHGFDINDFRTEFTYTNHEGKVSYKESPITQLAGPIMNLNNSTDNTEKIKILIKHGIDLTYNDPNDPYYTDFLSALLRNSQLSAESIDDLLGFMRNHDLDINNFKSRGTYINRDGKRVSYKQSPIRTITDSADATDKIKILIKHGIDLTYQDPNDLYYTDFLSALLQNSQLSAESIDDLLGFMHDHGFDINEFKNSVTHINAEGEKVSYKQSPIRTITDSADATDKIKILITEV
jgi:hypothetical protein